MHNKYTLTQWIKKNKHRTYRYFCLPMKNWITTQDGKKVYDVIEQREIKKILIKQ